MTGRPVDSERVRGSHRPHGGRVRAVVRGAAAPPARRRRTSWSSCSTTPASPTSAATAPTIDTPNIDRLAAGGLQFTNFHVTPLCSPTRAVAAHRPQPPRRRHARRCRTSTPASRTCAATSRNHAATVAEVLRDAGLRHVRASASGTWRRWSSARPPGPFDQWPLQRGFDRFYGFLDGETDQFHPELVVRQPPDRPAGRRPRTATTCREDLVDQALRMVVRHASAIRPDRPFFPYLAFGATHAPHQAPAGVPRQVPGPLRRGLGRRPRALVRAPARARAHPRGHRAGAAQPGRRAVGRPAREPAAARGPPAGGVRRVPRPHRRPDRPASSTASRELGELDNTIVVAARPTTAPRQEGGPFGVHARDEVLQRHPRDARRGDRSASTTSAARTATPTTRGAGRRPATRRSSGTSRTPTRAASTCR